LTNDLDLQTGLKQCQYKMQSETADFPPVPPPGELYDTRNIWIWPIRSIIYKNITSSTKLYAHITHCTSAIRERLSHK